MGLLDRPQAAQRYGLLSPDVMSLIQSGGPRVAPAPAQPPQRQRVSGLRVLDRVLGGATVTEGLDAERARLEAEAMRPQARQRMEANRIAAAQMGPAALLAFDNNPEAFAESLGMQFRPVTTAAGSQTNYGPSPFAFRVEQPTFAESGDQTLRRTSAGVAPIYTRTDPSIKEGIDRSVAETGRINALNVPVGPNTDLVDPTTGRRIYQGFRAPEVSSVPSGGSLAVTDLVTGEVINTVQGAPERRRSFEDANGVRRFEDDGSAVFPGDEVRVRSQARGRLDAATTSGDLLLAEVDKAIGLTGMGETGVVGAVMGAVPGTRALNLRRTIETIKANVGFNYLQQMRELSPTGGALGSLAVQEMQSLQSVLGSLDPNMGERELEGVLNQVKSIVEQGQILRERLYTEQFGPGSVGGGGQPAPNAPASGGVEDVVNPRTGERLRWNGSAWVRAQ